MRGFIPTNFWECVGFILGLVALYFFVTKTHNKYAERNYTYSECMYCHQDIIPMAIKVLGNKGWGHVECVEFRRRKRRI